jgi:hypothetical protein
MWSLAPDGSNRERVIGSFGGFVMRRTRDRLAGSVCMSALFLALVSLETPARAQSVTSAAAEQLYQDGIKLFDAGRTREACEKFASSQEAEPGLGTLLHLAICHEKEGRTASAWAEFNEALAQAVNRGEKDRERFAREHAQALEKQLHRVVLEMMNKPEGLELRLDGRTFPVGSLGTAIPLDPGEHQIEVRATKKKTWTQTLRLGPGAVTERIEIPALEDDASAPGPGGHPGNERAVMPVMPVGTGAHGTPPDTTKRWVGVGLGVVGIAAGITSVVEFATASSRQKTSEDLAAQSDGPGAHDAHSQAVTAQTYGFIFAGAAAVSLGVGAFLFATSFGTSAPTKSALVVVPTVGRGQAGLAFSGAF